MAAQLAADLAEVARALRRAARTPRGPTLRGARGGRVAWPPGPAALVVDVESAGEGGEVEGEGGACLELALIEAATGGPSSSVFSWC